MTEADDQAREDDDLLERLGALERDYDDAFPSEWEDVVRGTRSAEEVSAVRLAAGDDPEEVRALAQQLTPLPRDQREQWLDRLAEQASSPETPATDQSGSQAESATNVIALDERRSTTGWIVAAVGVLVAAALVLWLVPRDGGPTSPGQASTPPGFSLLVRNETVQEIRSADDASSPEATAQYQPTTSVHWVIRPEQSVDATLAVRVLAESEGADNSGERRLLDPGPVSVSERGVITIRGAFGDVIDVPPGRWSLKLVVAQEAPADLAALDAGGPWAIVEPAYVVDVIP